MHNETPLEAIVSLAQELIKLPSVATNTAAINEALVLCEKQLHGYPIKKFSSNGKPSLLIHNAQPETKQFTVLLNAHLDVIQGKDEQFDPKIIDGRLYGRGAYDMKSAAAVVILLFKLLAKQIAYPVALQITTDEEKGSNCAKTQVDEGYRADFIITGECGSNFRITNQAKGVYHVKLIATGASSHGAYPWLGDNAILKLSKAVSNIAEKYPLPKEESHKTTVNITRIQTTNEATNRTPDQAEAHLDIRYTPDNATILNDISALLPEDVTIETEAHYSPLDTKADNPYLKRLQDAGQKVLGQTPQLRTAHATSDIIRFVEAGCDGIEFGPIGGNQHNDNEWVDIQSLSNYYQVLKEFLFTVT